MNQRYHMNVHYQYYWSMICPKRHYENKMKPNSWNKNIIEKREIVNEDIKSIIEELLTKPNPAPWPNAIYNGIFWCIFP